MHLNCLYRNEPALFEQDDTYDGFEWIDFHDSDNSVVAFMRKSSHGEIIAFVVNATPVVREAYRIGVSGEGFYEEILNTDAETYGGANIGNLRRHARRSRRPGRGSPIRCCCGSRPWRSSG